MRLDVAERRAVRAREGQQRAHLVDDVGLDLGRGDAHLAPAEPAQVEVARVGADRDALARRAGDGPVDDRGVAGVEAARHVGRGDVVEERLVRAHRPGPEGLADVRVQVDAARPRPLAPVEAAAASGRSAFFSSRRSTTMSSMPCSSRNSARWKPSGSFWRIVCSMTRGPGEADERPRLGDVQVAEHREATP